MVHQIKWNLGEITVGGYLLGLFLCPSIVFQLTGITSFSTPDYIGYNLFEFHFSYLFVILIGFIGLKISKNMRLSKCTLQVVIWLIILLIYSILVNLFEGKIFTLELYAVHFVSGLCIISAIEFFPYEKMKLIWYSGSLVHVIGVWINFLFGLNNIQGRYNAQNMDVGLTGLLMVLIVVSLWNDHKVNFFFLLTLFITTILTGSRIAIILYIFVVFIIFLVYLCECSSKAILGRSITTILVALFVILSFINIVDTSTVNSLFEAGERIYKIVDSNFYEDANESGYGRWQSIAAGITVLKEHPFGVGDSIYKLQYEMQTVGYPTFPHSSLLSLVIIWGIPIASLLLFKFIILAYRLSRENMRGAFLILIILLSIIITGGPFVNWKYNWLAFVIIHLVKQELQMLSNKSRDTRMSNKKSIQCQIE